MPLANIQRAIDRQKDKNASQLQEVTYEGYGPGGVAIIVECTTDNLNRTYPDVRLAFSRHGGNLAEKGSVAFQFERRGLIHIKEKGEAIFEIAVEAGALDISEEEDGTILYTDPKDLSQVRKSLEGSGYTILSVELAYVPKTNVNIEDIDVAGKIIRLMDALEDLEDVSNTFVNFDISEDILAQLD